MPRSFAPSAPVNGSPGCPESRTLRRCRLRILGSPQLLRLRLCRSTSSGFPESCFCGWADVDFPAQLELCILDARPWMNLRVQSGLAHSRLTLDALINLIRPSTAVAGCGCRFQFILHCPVRPELRFQFPTGLPTGWRLGRFDLWIQVQKKANPVDFTMCGALIGKAPVGCGAVSAFRQEYAVRRESRRAVAQELTSSESPYSLCFSEAFLSRPKACAKESWV